jgi:hypothetical protein
MLSRKNEAYILCAMKAKVFFQKHSKTLLSKNHKVCEVVKNEVYILPDEI